MTTLKNNDFSDIAYNRKSIRVYDETVKISREEMLEMIEEATLAPSSVNMQPWRFVIVESDEAKATLKPLIRFNTRQNVTNLVKKSMTKQLLKARCHKKCATNKSAQSFLTTKILQKRK